MASKATKPRPGDLRFCPTCRRLERFEDYEIMPEWEPVDAADLTDEQRSQVVAMRKDARALGDDEQYEKLLEYAPAPSPKGREGDDLDELMEQAYQAGAAARDPDARVYESEAHWNTAQEIAARLRTHSPEEPVGYAARKALERVDMGYRYDHGYMDGGRGCRCSYDVWRKPHDACPEHPIGQPLDGEEGS